MQNKNKKAKAAMTLAWGFVREAGLPLGEAMHRAYLNIGLDARLKLGQSVQIAYRKADGTIRGAIAVAARAGQDLVKGTGHVTPSRNYLYFDVGVNDFRCFCKARLLAVL